MFKLIKRIICFSVIAVIVFFAIALRSGGDKFRLVGEKTGGVIKDSGEKLGKSADEIKKEKDKAAETIKTLTGGDKAAEDSEQYKKPDKKRKGASRKTAKADIKGPDAGSAEEDGNKTAADPLRSFWKNLREKISALTKG